MRDSLNGYCKLVQEIEIKRNEIMRLYYSKNIFHMMHRKSYKKLMNKYDEVLMHCYKFIEKQLEY